MYLSLIINACIGPFLHLCLCVVCSHFYKPLLRRGVGKMFSQSAVFFLSAFFHEVRTETRTAVSSDRLQSCENKNCGTKFTLTAFIGIKRVSSSKCGKLKSFIRPQHKVYGSAIRKRVNECGLSGRIARRKHLLSQTNMATQFRFAERYLNKLHH